MSDIPLTPRAGAVSKLAPVSSKAEQLVKLMILATTELGITAGDALSSATGYIVYIISHFKTDEDRAAALTAYVSAVQSACSGDLVVPLSQLVSQGKLPYETDGKKNPINRDKRGNIIS